MNLAPLKLTEVEKKLVHDEAKVHKKDVEFFKPFKYSRDRGFDLVWSLMMSGCVLVIAAMVGSAAFQTTIAAVIMIVIAIALGCLARGLFCWHIYRENAEEWSSSFYKLYPGYLDCSHLHGGKTDSKGVTTVRGFVIPIDLSEAWSEVANCSRVPDGTKQQIAAECGRLTLILRELPDADKLSDDEREVIQTTLDRQFAELGRAVDGAVAFEENGASLDHKLLAQRKVQEANALNKYLADGNKLPMTEIADAFEDCNSKLTDAAKNVKSLP